MKREIDFVKPEKAAELLECTVEQVLAFADEGLLRWRSLNGERVVRKDDVEELYRLHLAGELAPGELTKKVLFLERRVERLEAAMNMVFEVSGLSASRFAKMTEHELYALYLKTVEELQNDEWDDETLKTFAEAFIKITELEIDKINNAANISEAYMPFYRLCLKMSRFVGASKRLNTSVELQKIRDLLYAGRKNLQAIAILFIENQSRLGPDRQLLQKLVTADLESFDLLAKIHADKKGKLKLPRGKIVKK